MKEWEEEARERGALALFKERLTKLDWFYEMSDDFNVYTRGYNAVQAMKKLAQEKGGEWLVAFNQARNVVRGY